ncbi:hypothetical protein VPH35_063672 [Triticum aestivum]|uniref:Uncharacterized protein n=1 Tax=Aegilops tauschii TaxID=37682 RepID=M8BUJ2_AEGTA
MAHLKNLAVLVCVILASLAFAVQAVLAARGLAPATGVFSSMYTGNAPVKPHCDNDDDYCLSGKPAH